MMYPNSKRIITILFILVLIALTTNPVRATAKRPETPTTISGGFIVDVNQAKRMFDQGGVTFFDTRSALNYGKGHIPGAVCLPYKEKSEYSKAFNPGLDQVDLSKLPSNKDYPLIFYSHGKTGWKSYKAAVQSIQLGYTRVYWFREGISSWRKMSLPVD